jgi:hypothetical protein
VIVPPEVAQILRGTDFSSQFETNSLKELKKEKEIKQLEEENIDAVYRRFGKK